MSDDGGRQGAERGSGMPFGADFDVIRLGITFAKA
jgi:hypothetical protein